MSSAVPRLPTERVSGTPRSSLGAAAKIQAVLRGDESSDEEYVSRRPRAAAPAAGTVPRAPENTPAAGQKPSSFINSAPLSTPRVSALEIQRRRKIMFDSDDDDDDIPLARSTTSRTSSPGNSTASRRANAQPAARSKLSKLSKLWGREDEERSGGRMSRSSTRSASSDDEGTPLKSAFAGSEPMGQHMRPDHVRFVLDAALVGNSPTNALSHNYQDANTHFPIPLPLHDTLIQPDAVQDSQSVRSEDSGPRVAFVDDLQPTIYPKPSPSAAYRQRINGDDSSDEERLLTSGKPPRSKPAGAVAIYPGNKSPGSNPDSPRAHPVGIRKRSNQEDAPIALSDDELRRSGSGNECHPSVLSPPQLKSMGVPESIVQNGPEYVTQESLVNEIRTIRHDVTYLQRLHKAQVTYLDESTLKSETDLSMLRNVVGGLSRALFDAGITNEDIAASTFGQSQPTMVGDESAVVGFAEQGMVVDKPMISADFVINDGTNAPSKLNSSPDSHLASEARMAELNEGDSASLDLSSKRRNSAGSLTEPGHKHHEGILKSHQLKGLIAQDTASKVEGAAAYAAATESAQGDAPTTPKPAPPQGVISTPKPATPSTGSKSRIKVNKKVSVIRSALSGTAPVPGKIGIGISFGVTAKGEVFITGMAPNGPAKACGQIRRGDQLLRVDGAEVKGWDVNDIVKLIVGEPGTSVTLDVHGLAPDDVTAASPMVETPQGRRN